MRISLVGLGLLAGLLLAAAAADAQSPAESPGDVAKLVDIGGRRLFLECRGQGSPTVVLVSGYRASGLYWTDDLRASKPPRTMVLPAIAAMTRVCTYDRPGTYAEVGEDLRIGRSDAIAQPTTPMAMAADLHALLRAAAVPGPYVLAGHSLGGFVARLYASTHPDEVVGMVLIDAYSERLETILGPERWPALVRLNARGGEIVPIPDYGDVETTPFGGANAEMRKATAATPLRPMPLAVLAHARPFDLPKDPKLAQGFTSETLEALLRRANEDLATLVPDARFFVAEASGHDIHQDQPALVAEAIRQVAAGVRSRDTWYELASCCQAAR